MLGDELALVALLLSVHDRGAGPWGVSALLGASAITTVALAGVAGRVADLHDSRTVALWSGTGQVVVCMALAAATASHAPLVAVLALVALLQVGNAFAGPTWQALVPEIVGPGELGAAVGATQTATTVAGLLGPLLGGLVTGVAGAPAALLLDAVTFGALVLAALTVRTRRGGAGAAAEPAPAWRARDLLPRDGIAAVRADPLLRPLLTGLMAFVVVGELTNVAEVFLVRDTLGGSATDYGLVGAACMAGIVAGSALAGRPGRDAVLARRVVVAAAVLGLCVLLAGLAPRVHLLFVVFAVLGLANGLLNATVTTLLLRRTAESVRGRVISGLMGVSRAFSLGALALGGVAVGVLGPRGAFVAAGGLTVVVVAVLALTVRRVCPTVPPSDRSSTQAPRVSA